MEEGVTGDAVRIQTAPVVFTLLMTGEAGREEDRNPDEC